MFNVHPHNYTLILFCCTGILLKNRIGHVYNFKSFILSESFETKTIYFEKQYIMIVFHYVVSILSGLQQNIHTFLYFRLKRKLR